MNSQLLKETLTQKFGTPDQIEFETNDEGLVIVHIENIKAKATLCLQGAQILSWIKKDRIGKPDDVIWLSEEARFTKGKSIRGGIPICWPWFGAHPTEKNYPSHGYARTASWSLNKVEKTSNDKTFLSLILNQSKDLKQYHLKEVEVELQITLGEKLEMILISKNSGKNEIAIGGAFHTYFNVSNVRHVGIEGFENKDFIDTLDDWQTKIENVPIKINSEIDRIYQDDPNNENIIVDREFGRKICIKKQGSHSSVVWNPWIEKSKRLGDMGKEGYKKMVCLETCNALDDVISLKADEEHRLSVCYSVEDL